MNKKYIIRKNEEINDIIKCNKKIVSNYFVIYYNEKKKDNSRFCISVSKKIGKAHLRNLLKRQIKDILMKNNINNLNDYVIILRNNVLSLSYIQMSNELIKLVKGEKNE